MSTETTNKKIKIDNGTTFGRTYTDKAVDELLKGLCGGLPKLILNDVGGDLSADITNALDGIYSLILDNEAQGIGIVYSISGGDTNYKLFNGFLFSAGINTLANDFENNANNIIVSPILEGSYPLNFDCIAYIDENGKIATLNNPIDNNKYLTYNKDTSSYEWSTPTSDSKSISLFGNHSILVPKDSADTNIDMYLHSITVGKPNDTYLNGFTFLLPSSSNLVVDSIQDLDTILGTTPRMIPVSGCYNPGTPILITRLNWKGSFANSTLITTGGEEEDILSTFTSIVDVVTTL